MKKILLIAMLALSMTTFAKQENDTIPAHAHEVSRWIVKNTTNSNGKAVQKYYVIWRGELLTTNKTTYEKAQLCKEFGVKCALIVVGQKVNGTFKPKRICLN